MSENIFEDNDVEEVESGEDVFEDSENETPDEVSQVEQAFIDGLEGDLEEDDIKMAMIKAGASFKNVNNQFRQFNIKFGYVSSQEEKKSALETVMKSGDVNVSTEDGLKDAIDTVINSLRGYNEAQVSGMIRAYAKKNDIEIFVKPRGAGTRNSGFRYGFYQSLIENPHMTNDEVDGLIDENGSKNDKGNRSHYYNIAKLVSDAVKNAA